VEGGELTVEAWVLLAILVCPLTMGLMMFFMMRGKGHGRERGDDGDA
jgi:hypothetical protein